MKKGQRVVKDEMHVVQFILRRLHDHSPALNTLLIPLIGSLKMRLPAVSVNTGVSIALYHKDTGACLAGRVQLANTALTRLRGLLGRRHLAPGEALWLRPCNGIHTIGMLFAIDAIFLDRELRIVRLVENLRPFRLTRPQLNAHSVIELPAHTLSRFGLNPGDQLQVTRQ